jgi:leucyl-tRNA synthetase
LKDYGTGAIMAVPSDDDRDKAFATKFGIEIINVVDKSEHPNATASDKVGKMINSEFLNGLDVKKAIKTMFVKLEEEHIGKKMINYKLRDANFSRQRYWGEPIPITYDQDGVSKADSYDSLPLTLPQLEDFKPASGGQSPLARATDWMTTSDGRQRESDTMPGFAGSSWYFLRYMDALNDKEFASQEALNYWQDVDIYIGGTEHAVGHLMYSRFWHKFLFDLELVPTEEPFKKLINQGMIQGVIEYLYLQKEKVDGLSKFLCSGLVQNEEEYAKIPIHVDYVSDYGSPKSHITMNGIKQFIDWRPEYKDAIFECSKGIYHKGKFTPKSDAKDSYLLTHSEVGKMSKRYFNVVNPDDVIAHYGADCFRMYEMFLGPIEQSKPWDTKGIDGVSKFLKKFWSLYYDEETLNISEEKATKDELKVLHTAIKKVSEDIENFSFNTSVSAFMICVNDLKKLNCNKKEILTELCKLIAPFAPFISEELWHALGNESSVHHSDFPKFNEEYLKESEFVYPICVNGKKRDEKSFPADMTPKDIEAEIRNMESLTRWFDGKTPKKYIVVPKRMVNVVV